MIYDNKNDKMHSRHAIFMILLLLMLAIISQQSLAVSSTTAVGNIGISASLVNQNPNPAQAGDIFKANIGVYNLGVSTMSNIVVEAAPQYPFTLLTGEAANQTIGTLNAYQGYSTSSNMQVISYDLLTDPSVQSGTYNFYVKLYDPSTGSVVTQSIPITVENTQTAEIVYINQAIVIPGQETNLSFTVNNVGNAPLKNLAFSWSNSGSVILPVGSDNTQYVRYLDVGKSITLNYVVIADTNANPGLYPLSLNLNYNDPSTNQTHTIITTAGIYIGGITNFDVAYTGSTSGQASFSIANTGSNPATSVVISIPHQQEWSVSGSNSAIVGNLNKGDYTVASFTLSPASNIAENSTQASRYHGSASQITIGGSRLGNLSQQPNILTVEIAYTDTTGTRQTVDKQVQLNPSDFTSGLTLSSGTVAYTAGSRFMRTSPVATYGIYIIILAALVTLWIVYSKYRKKKLMDPGYGVFTKKKK